MRAFLICVGAAVLVGRGATAQPTVIERPIGPVVATTAPGVVPFGAAGFHILSDGRIVVGGTSVRLIDAGLKAATIIMDTARELPPSTPMGIVVPETNMLQKSRWYDVIPHDGDSTVVYGSGEFSLTLIGPHGEIGRTFALPFGEFPGFIGRANASAPRDSYGRLIVQAPGLTGDSAALLRVAPGSRRVDVVAQVRAGSMLRPVGRRDAGGQMRPGLERFPFGVDDAWGVLSDGTLLIIRSDCTLETLSADGRRRRGAVRGCAPVHLTPLEKQTLIDSVGVLTTRAGSNASVALDPRIVLATAAEVPDDRPVYRGGRMMGDGANHLWVERDIDARERQTQGDLYDVIDASGVVVDRVRVPSRAQIIGFALGTMYVRTPRGIARHSMQ